MNKYDSKLVSKSADVPKYEIFDQHYRMSGRVLHYFHEQTAKQFLQYTLAPVAGGTALGACVGACSASPEGVFVGASLGLASGLACSAYVNYGAYKEWLILHKETIIFNEFENLHREHPALQEFIDPITRCLALDPVRDPFGQIYDRSTLIALARRKPNGSIANPFQGKDFSISQIQEAPEVLAKMKAVYKVLLQRELDAEMSSEVVKGLRALINDLSKQIINYVTSETTRLTMQLRSGEISLQEFTSQINELTQRMSPQL